MSLDIGEAFSMLVQHERQMSLPIDEAKVLLNSSDANYRGRGNGNRGRGTYSGGRNGNGRGRGTKFCTYCNRNGHMVDTCYIKSMVIHLVISKETQVQTTA